MHASAAGAQVRADPAWATVPMLAVALMKSGPSLLIKAYRKHEQLRSEAQPNFGKLFSASLRSSLRGAYRLDADDVALSLSLHTQVGYISARPTR